MTKEEAIKQIEKLKSYCEYMADSDESGAYLFDLDVQALDFALSALRPITREQVEKIWKGEWEWFDETVGTLIDGYEREWGWRCSECKTALPDDFDSPDDSPAMRFCQWCGTPMTDEAVEILVKRMEGIRSV